jgi:hypothetical protein
MAFPTFSSTLQGKPGFRDQAWLGVLLVLLVTGVIRFHFLHVPLERDEGEFAYMWQLILDGMPPYTVAFNMKFPGIYYLYALFMGIFGETIVGIHLGLWLINAVSTVLTYRLGRRFLDASSAAVACAVFGLMTISPPFQGTSAHATQFLLPFALGGILLLPGFGAPASSGRLVASGVLFGLAVTVKQHAALFSVFGILAVLFGWGRLPGGGWRSRLRETLLLMAGMAAPLLLIGLGLAWAGCFPKFWFWTITYARHYVTILTPSEALARFLAKAPGVMDGWWWVMAGVGAGAIGLWLDPHLKPARWFLLTFLLLSFLSVCPGFYFRNHYFVTLVPALALLVGCAVSWFLTVLEKRWPGHCAGLVLFGIALTLPLLVFHAEFFETSDLAWSKAVYPFGCFPEMRAIGDRLKMEMKPGDQMAVLGSEPELYFYTHSRSATGYLYVYPLMEKQPLARQMQEEMIRQIEGNHPRFIVLVGNNDSWLAGPQSDPLVFRWMNGFLGSGYRAMGTVESFPGVPEFRLKWRGDAAAPPTRAPLKTFVLERSKG